METVHRYFLMQLRAAVEPGTLAWRTLKAAGRLWTLADALAFLDIAYVYQGHYTEAASVEAELVPIVQRLGHFGAAGTLQRTQFVRAAAARGDLAELDALLSEQGADPEDLRVPGYLPRSLVLRGILEFWRGHWPQAHAHVAQSIDCAVPFWILSHHGMLMVLQAFFGEEDAVLDRLEHLQGRLPVPGRSNLIDAWNLAVSAAEAAGLLGQVEWSRRLYPLVTEALETGTLMRQYDGRLLETSAGIAAAAAGLDDRAEAHFEAAVTQSMALPNRIEIPQTRHFYARFLLRRGGADDVVRAVSLLEEAVDGYETIGMRRHSAWARESWATA
jgi:hypothetical protein